MSLGRRRWLVPEVVQSSAMDCGPASLKSLLAGHSIDVGYGRLREACQTDVDGASIDDIEELAVELGLEAAQLLEPVEHVFLSEAELLPAIAIVRLPDGLAHFVVLWRRHGPLVQLMDPAVGRRWVSVRNLSADLYEHEVEVDASDFEAYARSDRFLLPLRRRLADLGMRPSSISSLVAAVTDEPGWRGIARLEGATRRCADLVFAGAIRRGGQAERLLERLAREGGSWVERKARLRAGSRESTVYVRGAVLVSVAGTRAPGSGRVGMSPAVATAAADPRSRSLAVLVGLLRREGQLLPGLLAAALLTAVAFALGETVLWRALIDVAGVVGLGFARVSALALLAIFLAGTLLVDAALVAGGLWIGRRLEARLRARFLSQIPRLGDHYFASRLRSDMAERSHRIHVLRQLPPRLMQVTRSAFQLLATTFALVLVAPRLIGMAVGSAALTLLGPLLALPRLRERDMRVRTHGGALARFTLDALLGLVALRAHRAEPAMRRGQEALVVTWMRAVRDTGRTLLAIDAWLSLVGLATAALFVLSYVRSSGADGRVLLVAYWAFELPLLGQALAGSFRSLAEQRNILERIVEPLLAADEEDPVTPKVVGDRTSNPGAHIAFVGVTLRVCGHVILDHVDLEIPSGCHVAIVGASGAGKSSLIGLLLGFHHPSAGTVLFDGSALRGRDDLARLRSETVWLDPSVHLWNRSVLANVTFGSAVDGGEAARAIETADLRRVCSQLPDGLQTSVGDGGARLSGGEGQRVRYARALCRPAARLLLFDEPFRGLDRERRSAELAGARATWRASTLLCVTHDIADTRDFPRVVVMDGGRIIEDGSPEELLGRSSSRYGELMNAELRLREGTLGGAGWRRIQLRSGRLEP